MKKTAKRTAIENLIYARLSYGLSIGDKQYNSLEALCKRYLERKPKERIADINSLADWYSRNAGDYYGDWLEPVYRKAISEYADKYYNAA